MELRTHEDTNKKSECRVRFHFIFDIIKETKNPILNEFDWDVNSAPVQRLYLSRDTKKLMEVINNFIATVYKRVDIEPHMIDPDALDDENKQDENEKQHEDYG